MGGREELAGLVCVDLFTQVGAGECGATLYLLLIPANAFAGNVDVENLQPLEAPKREQQEELVIEAPLQH